MSEQTCCDKNISEQFTCGQLRVEIDRLKAELEYTKEMANAFMDERNDLRSQLAEARAELERFKHMAEQNSTEMCEWMEKANKARKQTAQEIIAWTKTDNPLPKYANEALRSFIQTKFGLEG